MITTAKRGPADQVMKSPSDGKGSWNRQLGIKSQYIRKKIGGKDSSNKPKCMYSKGHHFRGTNTDAEKRKVRM